MRLWSLLAAVLATVSGAHTSGSNTEPEALFRFQDPAIIESSGVAVRGDRFVTHNDSGDEPRFFVVDGDGCTVGRHDVGGAAAVDWEDMAAHDGRLFFGDIGDNASTRPQVVVYEVAAPAVDAGTCAQPVTTTLPATARVLAYDDGAHDAEGLAVDPDGVVHVVTKAYGADDVAGLYEAVGGTLRRVADLALPAGVSVPDDPVAAIPFGLAGGQAITGAAFSPDGSTLVVRTYAAAYLFDTADYAAAPTTVELPAQPQGEAVTFTADGDALVITSEDPFGSRPPVWLVPLS